MRVLVAKPTDTYYAERLLEFPKRTYAVECGHAPLDWTFEQVVEMYAALGHQARLYSSTARIIEYRTKRWGRTRIAFADWRPVNGRLVLAGLVLLPWPKGRAHRLWTKVWTRPTYRPGGVLRPTLGAR